MDRSKDRYEIQWRDSGKWISGWKSREEIESEDTEVVETVGYKMYETDDTVYLALTRDMRRENFFGVQLIDKKNIVSERLLRER